MEFVPKKEKRKKRSANVPSYSQILFVYRHALISTIRLLEL